MSVGTGSRSSAGCQLDPCSSVLHTQDAQNDLPFSLGNGHPGRQSVEFVEEAGHGTGVPLGEVVFEFPREGVSTLGGRVEQRVACADLGEGALGCL